MNILITGATSGFGRTIAINYANKDNNLYLIGRKNLDLVKSECELKGANVFVKNFDVRNKNEMYDYLKKLDIDIVFANAGVSGGTSNNDIYSIFETNVFGVLNTITPIIENMIIKRSGRIVIISSLASFRGLASAPAYSSSKACIRYYGEALNNLLKKYNINVNVVCPGFIKTPLTDKNNFIMPFIMTPEFAFKKMMNGINKNKKFIIYPKILYYFIKILNVLPFNDYIFSKLPSKDL